MKRTIRWPPKPEPRKERKHHFQLRDGEHHAVELQRWHGDAVPHGFLFEVCCECGLRHLTAYDLEYVDTKTGTFILHMRHYRVPRKA